MLRMIFETKLFIFKASCGQEVMIFHYSCITTIFHFWSKLIDSHSKMRELENQSRFEVKAIMKFETVASYSVCMVMIDCK